MSKTIVTPRSGRVPVVDPDGRGPARGQSARAFGFPLVVKARVGSSGNQVNIVRDLEALLASVGRGLGRARECCLYEQYVDGDEAQRTRRRSAPGPPSSRSSHIGSLKWRYPAGSASRDSRPWTTTQLAHHSDASAVEAPRLHRTGSTLTSFATRTGGDWLIDFNARAFGGVGEFPRCGARHQRGLSLSPSAAPAPAFSPDARLTAFPSSAFPSLPVGRHRPSGRVACTGLRPTGASPGRTSDGSGCATGSSKQLVTTYAVMALLGEGYQAPSPGSAAGAR